MSGWLTDHSSQLSENLTWALASLCSLWKDLCRISLFRTSSYASADSGQDFWHHLQNLLQDWSKAAREVLGWFLVSPRHTATNQPYRSVSYEFSDLSLDCKIGAMVFIAPRFLDPKLSWSHLDMACALGPLYFLHIVLEVSFSKLPCLYIYFLFLVARASSPWN